MKVWKALIAPGVVEETHKDVYYIDGCTQEECLVLLEKYGELLVNDGMNRFGFGCHESGDEIMLDKYNVVTIYSRILSKYNDFFEAHEINRVSQLVTAWDTFSDDTPGQAERYDYYHTIRVYKLATKIAKQENADVKIVQLAALLHDVDDIKLSPDTYVTKKNAVDFMTINKIDGKRIEAVCKIIDEVSFAGTDSVVPDTIEGKCVQDADRLDAIGAIGIARTFAYGGSRGRKIYDPEIKSKMGMNKEEYRNNQDSTSINHFYEKLLLLKDMMNTTERKKLAEHRQVVMQEFLNEFMLEWEGKM